MSLGMEKEVVNIVDGRITEELYYNSRGEELYCRLYKNGKLYRSARIHYSRGDWTKHNVIYYEYDEKSNELIPPVIRTGRIPNEGSFLNKCAVIFLKVEKVILCMINTLRGNII